MELQKLQRTKSRVKSKQLKTHNSVVCGVDNPLSLGVTFYCLESGEVACKFTPQPMHEGHAGIMHGGLTGTLLDETMGRSNRELQGAEVDRKATTVTSEYKIHFYKPVLTGVEYMAVGKIIRVDGRYRYAEAYVIDEEGYIYTKTEGTYVAVDFVDDSERVKGIPGNTTELDENDPTEM